ncbi:hypothetical protein DCC27_009395 [Auritidibacter sp. NML130574]|nr:hypothetical protein DCC27_009395 [Auritidibacter sp. NML130574]PXA79497.1 hypothetical protein DCC26_05375 [Auritidibacter sp. NML120779]
MYRFPSPHTLCERIEGKQHECPNEIAEQVVEHLEWLQQPCPHWCHCDHSGQEHPTDRKRLADQPFATLITQEPEHREQREFKDSIKAEDMAIAVYRKRGETTRSGYAS